MTNSIVSIIATQTVAPAPSTLQGTGAIISQGGTNLAAGSDALLTQPSDLMPLLGAPITLASLSSAAVVATGTLGSTTIASGTYNATTGLVTLTLTAPIGVGPGDEAVVCGHAK